MGLPPTGTTTPSTAPRTPPGDPRPGPGPVFHALDATGRFRRDTPLGAILHPGRLSFREVAHHDSLHVVVDGSRISVHVDQICPIDCAADGPTRYPLARVLAHNLADVAAGLVRRVRGRHRPGRCNLECEAVWEDDESA